MILIGFSRRRKGQVVLSPVCRTETLRVGRAVVIEIGCLCCGWQALLAPCVLTQDRRAPTCMPRTEDLSPFVFSTSQNHSYQIFRIPKLKISFNNFVRNTRHPFYNSTPLPAILSEGEVLLVLLLLLPPPTNSSYDT